MDVLTQLLSVALTWGAGCALLAFARWPGPASATAAASPVAGRTALLAGYGYFAGLLVLALWMRLLSIVGIAFGRLSIGLPLASLVVAGLARALQGGHISTPRLRAFATTMLRPPWPRWQRALWLLLLAWLGLRFGSLLAEIASRPLYPWDAWTQWAPKARVWYALGRMVAFVPGAQWLTGTEAYFDAAPGNPATVPLLQAWGAIALGRWDDSVINVPWLFMLVALALAVYGMLRDRGVDPVIALLGAYLVASLPLADTHAALAGYADLMLAGVYTLAALAVHRWALHRMSLDAVIAILLAAACPLVDVSGRIWVAMLVPGLLVAWLPHVGRKIMAWAWAAAALALIVFSPETPWFGGFVLHPALPWRFLAETFFLFDNWHLLWYVAIALAIVGARKLAGESLSALTAIVGSSVAWLIVAALFSADVVRWFPVAAVINRAALHVAPLVVVLGVLVWRELTASREEARAGVALTHA